jgi:hypothetical protein
MKLGRMGEMLDTYVKNFNKIMNRSFGLFIDISTKIMTLGIKVS